MKREAVFLEPRELLCETAKILDNKKALDIRAIDIEGVSILADYFLLASGTSSTQVKALAEEVEFRMSGLGVEPLRVEGEQTASWIIMDYGSVVIHIFHTQTREFFNLERLWADGKFLSLEEMTQTPTDK
ncbi:MAG TPA: ribosome silencing factor [Clostridia bacterium]|nr:ribosome silencing factor [Clostridia bacterium]